ncbi:MAG: hypothetical protein PHR45_06490 [Muribaculaceae bacterium]|nr:hypothetical protein [Muribaculaceae bacterium]
MRQDRIQNLRMFEEEAFDTIQDYLDNKDDYPTDSALIVNNYNHEISIEKTGDYPKCTTYIINNYLSLDEDGFTEPDVDAINELASTYFFVR